MRLKLTAGQSEALHEITDRIAAEYAVADNLREEMLRILLKRFIITCTRVARERFAAGAGSERQFDIVRRYYVLVDRYFREKKQVQEYALLLHLSLIHISSAPVENGFFALPAYHDPSFAGRLEKKPLTSVKYSGSPDDPGSLHFSSMPSSSDAVFPMSKPRDSSEGRIRSG